MDNKKKKAYIKPIITLEYVVIEEPIAATSQMVEVEIVGPNGEDSPFHSWDEVTGQRQQYNW